MGDILGARRGLKTEKCGLQYGEKQSRRHKEMHAGKWKSFRENCLINPSNFPFIPKIITQWLLKFIGAQKQTPQVNNNTTFGLDKIKKNVS